MQHNPLQLGGSMRIQQYFCHICVKWFDLKILSEAEAEEAIRKGYPLGPPRCPQGHILYKRAA